MWKSVVKQLQWRPLEVVQDARRQEIFHQDISSIYTTYGVRPPQCCFDKKDSQFNAMKMYICYDCGYSTPSTRGWWRHRREAHSVLQTCQLYLDATVCQVCHSVHHTLERLWRHVSHSRPSCLHCIVNTMDPLSQDRVAEAQAKHEDQMQQLRDKGRPNRYAWPPIDRLPGPERGTSPRKVAEQALQFDIPTIEPELLPQLLRHLLEGQAFVPKLSQMVLCPAPFRKQDFQYYADELVVQSNLPVVVLSIDIVNDALYVDLTSTDIGSFWMNTIVVGQTLAVLGGPPCETWTAVRLLELFDRKKPPRPVCSSDSLWGLDRLTASECQPVRQCAAQGHD